MRNDRIRLGLPLVAGMVVRLGASAHGRLDDLARASGIVLPDRPGEVAGEMPVALWRAPFEWLVLTQGRNQHAQLLDRVQQVAADATALVVDYSDASSVVELSGSAATAALARVCTLDFATWPESGAYCVPAACARVSTLVHRLAPARFWLHVDRSLEQYLWTWLQEVVSDLEDFDQ